MAKIEIKEFKGEEMDHAIDLAFYAFAPSPGSSEKMQQLKPYFKEDTAYVLYEDDNPVSALVCKPIPQNVRGVIKSMCGIQNVATHPEARRKGYSKKLMVEAFDYMKRNNIVFSTLYPFKEAFYERLGYITFPQIRTAEITASNLEPLISLDINGYVERIEIKNGFEVYKKFLHQVREQIHGMGVKADAELERVKNESPYWLAVAKEDKEVLGIMTYKITSFWKEIKVRDFYYLNSQGKYLLLKFLAKHADQVKEIHLPIRPNEFPETWINDTFWGEKGKIKSRDWVPCPMGRVVIIEEINGLIVGTGKISIKITDDFCEWNNNVFTFESKDGILHVDKSENYDCELSIQGLSAIIYGNYNLDDFSFKSWGDLNEESKEKIKQLFPQYSPHLHADF
ncbi:MAG: GNAT family N-acetyltransferase [Candidatus Heimdallarchaeaceae archaeon]|jgi:predicted acetyltransferase